MANALEVKIIGDPSSLKRAFGDIESSGHRLGGFLSGAFKASIAGAAAGLGTLTVAAKIGWDEFSKVSAVNAQTAAALKSTGGAANVTATHISDLGIKLQNLSGVNHTVVQASENMLLSFKHVRNEVGAGNDVFDRASRAALDYSVRTGKDASNAAVIFGKALEDPIGKIGALSRAGIVFTQGQKDQIKALVESGHTLEAQKLILGSLEQRYSGAAEAAGKTLPGQLSILREQFNQFAGDMVGKAVPALTSFISLARDHMPEVKQVIGDAFQHISDVFVSVWPTIKLAFDTAWVFFRDNLLPIIRQLGEIFVDAVKKIAGVVQEHMPEIRRILGFVGDVIKGIAVVAIPLLKFAFEVVLPTAIGIAITAISGIVTVLRGIGNGIRDVVGWFKDLPGNIADAITGGITLVKNAVTGLFGKVIDWVKETLGIKSPSSVFHEIGVNLIKGFIGGVGSMAGALKQRVVQIVKDVAGASGLYQPDPFKGTGLSPATKDAGGNVALGRNMAAAHGWTGGEFDALYRLWTQESGWSQYAKNKSSGAYGIPQALPESKLPAAGRQAGGSDAAAQIGWGLGYIHGTYGSPSRAWAHEQAFNWYATGGVFDKPSIIGVGEAGPEAVVPLAKWMDGWQQVKTVTQDGWVQVRTTVHETTQAVKEHHATSRELLQKILNAVTPLNASLRDVVAAVNKAGSFGGGSSGSFGAGSSRSRGGGSSGSSGGGGWVQVTGSDGSSGWVQVHPENAGFVQVFPSSPGGGAGPLRMAAGGIVTRPTRALIGEAGPEAVVPLSRGLGGITIHLNVDTLVGDDNRKVARDLLNAMVAELTLYQQAGGRLS